MLLAPFGIRHLRAAHISPLATAADAYGPAWTEQLVDTWTRDTRTGGYAHIPPDAEWVKRLPDATVAACHFPGAPGPPSGSARMTPNRCPGCRL